MSKFIDAYRLRAEIVRLKKEKPFHDDPSFLAYLHGLSKIEDFIDSIQQEQPVTATGKVFTNPNPKNLLVENKQWDELLSQFDNGQRVRIILVKEDAE